MYFSLAQRARFYQRPKYKKYKRGVSTRLSGPSWSVTLTQREKLTYCPETVLASVRSPYTFIRERAPATVHAMRFSSVLADLAMWLWIGLLRKEAEWQVVLLWVAPSVAG